MSEACTCGRAKIVLTINGEGVLACPGCRNVNGVCECEPSGEPARPDLEALIKQHFAMTWINYPDYPAKCFLDGIAWPCEVGTLARYALAQEARGAELERRAERAEQALQLWEKFRWYATGESGHSPLTMPLWYALVFEEAAKQGMEALGLAAALGGGDGE